MAYTQPTITAIDSVLAKVQAAAADNNPFNNVTGMIGSIMSAVPGTPAHDVKMDIQTIQQQLVLTGWTLCAEHRQLAAH